MRRAAPFSTLPRRIVSVPGTLVFCAATLGPIQTLPASEASMEHVRELVWFTNWSDAADAADRVRARGLIPTDEPSRILLKVVEIRGRIESRVLPEAAREIMRLLERVDAHRTPELRIQLLSALGDITFQYDLQASQTAWREAGEIASKAGNGVWEARCNGQLGTIAFLNGDLMGALRQVSSATLRAEYYRDVAGEIRLVTALGEGLSGFGREADAMRFFEKALDMKNSVPGMYFPFTAYLGKARILATWGRSAEARQMLADGLALARAKSMHVREARLMVGMGEIATGEGKYDEARNWLTQASALAAHWDMFRIRSDAESRLADVALKLDGPDGAAPHALRSVEAAQHAADTFSLPRKLAVLAEIDAARGDIAQAENVYQQAGTLVDSLLRTVPYTKDKNTLIGAMERVFEGHVALALEALHDPAKAFDVLEAARARGLLEIIQRTQAHKNRVPLGSPMNSGGLALVHQKLATESDPAKRGPLLNRLWETEIRSFRAAPAASRPPEVAKVSLREVQSRLSPGEVIVEYVLGPSASFALAIRRDRAEGYRLPPRAAIEAAVGHYAADVVAMKDARSTAHDLYRMVLAPVRLASDSERLVVVPDGRLHLVPFDGLVDDAGRYVLANKIVSYAPSATVNYYLSRPASTSAADRVLAVGGVRYGGSAVLDRLRLALRRSSLFDTASPAALPALPQAEQEVSDVDAAFPDQSVALTGDRATESAVRRALDGHFRVLHFALHSVIDEGFPDRSALVLAKDPAGTTDGLLQAREIIGLNLKSDLVTVSACDAGWGKVEGIAGMNSLMQAFLIAGARSVVASTWAAEDAFTTALMRRFYAHLKRGEDKATALTLAKRDLIAMYESNAKPFYWAGFRLVGDAHGTIERRSTRETTGTN